MRIKLLVLFLFLLLTNCALYEKVKNRASEGAERVSDKVDESTHKGTDYISEKMEEVGDSVKEMYHRARDISSEKLEDIRDTISDTVEKVKNVGRRIVGGGGDVVDDVREGVSGSYEDFKEGVDENLGFVGEKVKKTKEGAKNVYYKGKRKFNKATSMLEDVYYIGLDKLDRMYRRGKLRLLDFKDILGDKYDQISDYFGDLFQSGKDIVWPSSKKVPRKITEFYDLLWDNLDELVSSGKLTTDQIKEFFGDKFEDVKDMAKDKMGIDLESKDLERWKKLLGEWKDKVFKPEESKTWWTKFTDSLTSLKNRLTGVKEEEESFDLSNLNFDHGMFGLGWQILSQLVSNKKLKLEDLKDLLGDKFDTVSDYLNSGDWGKLTGDLTEKYHWIHDLISDHLGDFFEGSRFNFDKFHDTVVGMIPDEGIAGRSKDTIKDDISRLKELIGYVKEKGFGIKEPTTFWERFTASVERIKDSAKEKLGFKPKPKRVFDQVTNKLEDLYNIGWDKLDNFFRTGKIGLEDFKDLLGDRYQEVFNYITDKLDDGKEGIKEVWRHGKRVARSPERLRDIYELIWDYVDEQYRKGSIGFEQIKDIIGDKFDDWSDTLIEGIDKSKEVVKDVTGEDKYDKELERFKRKIIEMRNLLSEHTEGGSFWDNLVHTLSSIKNKAWSSMKGKTSGTKEHPDTSSTEL